MKVKHQTSAGHIFGASGGYSTSTDSSNMNTLICYFETKKPKDLMMTDSKSNTWTFLGKRKLRPRNIIEWLLPWKRSWGVTYFCQNPTTGLGHSFSALDAKEIQVIGLSSPLIS